MSIPHTYTEHCARTGKGKWSPDQCRICWIAVNGKITPPKGNHLPCSHLGGETGELVDCPACTKATGRRVQLKVFSCSIHGKCLPGKSQVGIHGCGPGYCEEYLPNRIVPTAGQTRHLLFHLYPTKEGGVWKWHQKQLQQRIKLFNGRKILAVAQDETTENELDLWSIVRLFDKVYYFSNDPSKREVLTFHSLFSSVNKYIAPEDAILWAHGKGTGRHLYGQANRWSELLYSTCMDYWPRVQKVLQTHPIAGSFRKVGRGWKTKQSRSNWHYSGSWCWYRCADLFAKSDWNRIDQFEHGIESYPSLHFSAPQAGVIFHSAKVHECNLYDPEYWIRSIEPAYEQWLREEI